MNIEKLLKTQHQICLAHKRIMPYTSIRSFILMTIIALIICFFIDSGPRYTSKIESQTAVILAMTPIAFMALVFVQACFQKTVFNADVYITRKGISLPDLKGEKDFFTPYAEINSLHIYYFPLSPLFVYGPKINTHFKISDVHGVSKGVHTMNVKNIAMLKSCLHHRDVPIKYHIARWPLAYLTLFILMWLLAFSL